MEVSCEARPKLTARTMYSTNPSIESRWRNPAIPCAKLTVASPVVLSGSQSASPSVNRRQSVLWGATYSFAKTPLKAAHAPLATARTIQWFLWAQLIPSASAACAVSVLSRGCCSPGRDASGGSPFCLMTPGSGAPA